MIFTEPRFILFFAAVFAVHWMLGSLRSRKIWLLLVSYFFYAAWDWRFLSLILISTGVDYVVGLKLEEIVEPERRRHWVVLSLVANLGILGIFKYFNFFADSLSGLLVYFGLPLNYTTLNIVLPVGISFYTFQTMSYSIDIYRGRLQATQHLLDLALFVGFFPQLVAGPIVRAKDFLPQLRVFTFMRSVAFRSALMLFLVGFIKKACISDNISTYVDRYFSAPLEYTALSAWIAVLLYAVQIYCDFSGYSDMAIACARMLGYELGDNFNAPYLARNIKDFWRRWHMSLSSWLRDYLYISLGGSRGGTLFTYRNLMITMLLGGLWHGASWNFVIWGGLHGAALVIHREWSKISNSSGALGQVISFCGPVLTFYWVCIAWIFFRADGLTHSLPILKSFVLFQDLGPKTLEPKLLLIFFVLVIFHILAGRLRGIKWWQKLPEWGFAFSYGLLVALVLSMIRLGAQPFIYFQF